MVPPKRKRDSRDEFTGSTKKSRCDGKKTPPKRCETLPRIYENGSSLPPAAEELKLSFLIPPDCSRRLVCNFPEGNLNYKLLYKNLFSFQKCS